MDVSLLLAQVLMCFASVGCLISGAVMLHLATKGIHESAVHDYVRAVGVWASKRREFAALNISASTDASDRSVAFAPRRAPDGLHDTEEGFDLPAYERLTYRARPVPLDFFPVADLGDVHTVAPKERVGQTVALTLALDSSTILIEALPLVHALAHREPGGEFDHCSRQNGIRVGSMCWVYSRLQRLCLQVALNASSQEWELAPRTPDRNMSYGCDYAGGEFPAAVYKAVPASEVMAGGRVAFSDVTIEVCSHFDPHFSALELTEGKLAFGMTAQEEDALGIVLICMGVAFCLPPGCAFLRARYRRRRGAPRPRQTRWRRPRGPEPEMVGMKYAVDVASGPPERTEVDSDSVMS